MSVLVLLSAFCSIVLGKLRMPALIGFLLAGIIIANYMTIPEDMETIVSIMSNLGLIMLMFSIGMEIDIRKLKSQGRFAIIVSAIQIPLMVVGGIVAGSLLGFSMLQSITLGCIISGSSTAVVMAILKQAGTLDKEHMELLVLVIIIEDIAQVIMLSMLTPMLGGSEMSTDALAILILEIAIFMVACFTLGLYIVPRVIDWFYERANDELISLLCIGAAFTLAWAANGMGLSVAIGAFLTGVFVGTTKPKEVVEHFVEPLKSVFMAMFFISVGMEVAIGSLVDNIVLILIIFAVFAVCKFATVYFGYWVGNGDSRNGFISALGLCAMGEFAFIIAKQALNDGVFDADFYSSVIGAALVSMIVLPFMSRGSDKTYDKIVAKMPGPLSRFFAWMTARRDGFYGNLNMVSSRAKDTFARGLTDAYFLVILIVILEVVFYYIYDPLCWWLSNNIGLDDFTWRISILIVNLLVLLYPCEKLIKSIRNSLHIFMIGKKMGSYDVPREEEKVRLHETLSPLIIGFAIDIVIVMLVPNGIDNMTHIYVAIGLLIITVAFQIWKSAKGKKDPSLEKLEEASAELLE